MNFLSRLFNTSESEVIKLKEKFPEEHVQLGSLEACREFAEAKAKTFPSDKVKINEYKWRSGVLRGYKCIPFCDTDLDGNPSKCYIYKVVGKNNS